MFGVRQSNMPAADGGQNAIADIHYRATQKQIQRACESVFSVQYVLSVTVPNVCSQQLFYKHGGEKKNLCTCQNRF